jgi:hypothetical protein
MERLILLHDPKNARDEFFTFEVRELPQVRRTFSEMILTIGITAGTAKRALARQLNG